MSAVLAPYLRPLFVIMTAASVAVCHVLVFAAEISPTSIDEAIAISREWNESSLKRSSSMLDGIARQSMSAGDVKNAAAALIESGRVHLRLGNRTAAEASFRRAIELSNDAKLINEKIVAVAELSLLSFESGESDKANQLSAEALELAKTGASDRFIAYAYFASAELTYFNVELNTSLDHYNKAIELWGDADPSGTIRGRLGLGYLFLRSDKNREGHEQFDLAHKLATSIGDRRSQAITLKSLGSALNNLNQKQAALERYFEAERLFPASIDRMEKGILYNGIGSIYEYYRDWSEARKFKSAAYDLFVEDRFVYGEMVTLSNLAMLSFRDGDEAAAFRHLAVSNSLAIKLKNKYHLALAREEFANIHFEKGNFRLALPEYEASAAIYAEIKNARQAANVLSRIGQIYIENKDYEKAAEFLDRAEVIVGQVRDSFTAADIRFQRARLYFRSGDLQQAVPAIMSSLDLTIALSDEIANTKLQRSFRASVFERLELFVEIAFALRQFDPSIDRHSLAVVESFRARSLIHDLRFSTGNSPTDNARELTEVEFELLRELNSHTDKITELLSQNSDTSLVTAVDADIAETRRKLEALRGEIRASDPQYEQLRNAPGFDLEHFVQNELEDDTVMLEYLLGTEKSFLWIADRSGTEMIALPGEDTIHDLVRTIDLAARPQKIDDNGSLAEFQRLQLASASKLDEASRQLTDILLRPAAGRLYGKRLLIIPDRSLSRLSFALLRSPSDPDKMLIEINEIVYQPSAAALTVMRSNEGQPSSTRSTAMIFADPVFSTNDERLRSSDLPGTALNTSFLMSDLPRLPASHDEAVAIANELGTSRTELVTGFDAKRSTVFSESIKRHSILHFATHGIVSLERPEKTGLALSAFGSDGHATDGGSLRLNDIYSLRLRTDLVVLSACETAVGRDQIADVPPSLTSAFIQAGSTAVVSSFWKVDDEATKELMVKFYSAMQNDGLPPPAALRAAQLSLMREGRFNSPTHWASFAAFGQYTRPVVNDGGWLGFWQALFGF